MRVQVCEVRASLREESRVHQPVDGSLAEVVELLLRGGHDHADGLPAELDRGEQRVAHVCPLLVGGVGSPARLDERPAVVRLRGVRDVVALAERAGGLLYASVAHVGCVPEVVADLLPEVLAHLEAPPLALERRLPPVGVPVDLRARLEVLADRVGASVALVAPAHAVLHLVGDRGDRASEHFRHLGEGQSAFEPVGYAFPRVYGHVLCHDVLLLVCVCCPCATGTPGPAHGLGAYYRMRRWAEGGRTARRRDERPKRGLHSGASRPVSRIPSGESAKR